MEYKSDKITVRMSPDIKKTLEGLVKKRREKDPNFTLSNLMREAADIYVGLNEDPFLYLTQTVQIARRYGITSEELIGTLMTIYKTMEHQEKQETKDPR